MRVTLRYSAGKQVLSAGKASIDLMTLKPSEAQELRNNVIRSMFPATGEAHIATEARKAAEREARRAERAERNVKLAA